MDLQVFKAFAEANEIATRSFKRIIYSLIASLFLFITLFGGSFFYFMYKAFSVDTSAYLVQDVNNEAPNNSTIARIG
jgi:hypothetical protein